MSMTAQDMIDRRRLRRKLSFWRISAILVAALAVVVGAVLVSGTAGAEGGSVVLRPSPVQSDRAGFDREGLITEDDRLLDLSAGFEGRRAPSRR